MSILYRRTPGPVIPSWPGDRERFHDYTGGIVHMLDCDKRMTLEEIIGEAEKYNETFDGPFDGHFETDPLLVAQYLGLLCQVGMVVATIAADEEGEC